MDLFSFQQCSRFHDKAFGILGITNSRLEVDYSRSIIELFMAALADYFLSLGFMTVKRGYWEVVHLIRNDNNDRRLLAPFAAFGLDPFDPVVYLVSHEISEFFAPSYAEALMDMASTTWSLTCELSVDQERDRKDAIVGLIERDGTGLRKFVSVGIGFAKMVWSDQSIWSARKREAKELQSLMANENSVMMAPYQGGESKTYSEWVAMARTISTTMLERFLETGEDAAGELDDEAWALVG